MVNVDRGAVLLRLQARVVPGARVEVQVTRGGVKETIAGRVVRCAVCGLRPLSFEAVVQFETPLPPSGDGNNVATTGPTTAESDD